MGQLYGGYQTNYDWHGFVPSSLLVDHGSYYGGVNLITQPQGGFSFRFEMAARSVDGNNDLQNHMLVDEYAMDAPWVYNNLSIKDETTLFAGFRQELGGDWALTLGYRLYRGGLPGLASDFQRGKDGDSLNQLDHQAEARFAYSPGKTGFFITAGGAYSFEGAKGWLLDAGLGWKWDVCSNVSAVLSGNAYFSFSYWDVAGKSMKGSDGYQAKFMIPIQATPYLTVSPFIACNWEGSNSDHISARTAYYLHASKATRSFSTIVGVEACWTF